MTTFSDLIQETKRYLYSMQREEMNLLQTGFTSVASPATQQIMVANPLKGIQSGALLAIDLELFYVMSSAGTTATVIGGQMGSVPAAHASGALITVNPKFPDFTAAYAINQEITSLSSPDNGLYQVKDVDITYNPAKTAYDLAGVTNIIDIQSVRFRSPGPDPYETAIWNWRLDRSEDVATFPSGLALSFYEPAYPGQTVHVHYRSGFSPLVNLTDDASITGLPTTAYDIPPLGAAIRLMAGREVKRNFTEAQDEPKRAQEVPPGAVAGSVKNLMMLWQRRVFEEASRLSAAYPRIGVKGH
jgi:hypothetical protein